MSLTKEKMEKTFRKAGVVPVARSNLDGYEVFIGDGFSKTPHVDYGKFGVEDHHFPNGAFVGLWFLSQGENVVSFGRPIFFHRYHDFLQIHGEKSRQKARIKAVMFDAVQHIDALKDHKKKGTPLNG